MAHLAVRWVIRVRSWNQCIPDLTTPHILSQESSQECHTVTRPILRWLFVGAARGFIRLLPSLSQIVDIELDSMTIVFEDLANAHINIRGVTLATKAVFSQLADTNARSSEEAKVAEKISEHKRLSRTTAGWGNRLALSSRRTWRRAWSVTQGSTSISLRLQGITVSDNPWQRSVPQRTSSSSAHASVPQTPMTMSFVTASHGNADDDLLPGVVSLRTVVTFMCPKLSPP